MWAYLPICLKIWYFCIIFRYFWLWTPIRYWQHMSTLLIAPIWLSWLGWAMIIRVSKRDLFWILTFADWIDNVFWCKTKNISRIFHSVLVWGNWTFLSFENIEAPCWWSNVQTFLASLVMLVPRQIQFLVLF